MVDAGRMLWHDQVTPALSDGRYRLTLTPDLAGGPAPGELDVLVGAPPPDPATIRSVPAAGTADADPDGLPFVLLERRTLPWERAGFARAGIPWLALVLSRDDDTEARLEPGPPATWRCVDLATQARLLPRPDEVRLLAHVREQAPSTDDEDGWQAVVLANRLPRTPGRWRATLLDLSGRADLLPGGAPVLGVGALWSATFTVGGEGRSGLAAIRPTRFADPARFGPAGSEPGLLDESGAVLVATRDLAGAPHEGRLRSPLRPDATPVTADDDLTEVTAETLGRLMALADPRLLADLLAYHRARQHHRVRAGQLAVLGDTLGVVAAPGEDVIGSAASPAAAPAGDATADDAVTSDAAVARGLPVLAAQAAAARWQTAKLPVAGALGTAAAPVRPGMLRRRRDGGWS